MNVGEYTVFTIGNPLRNLRIHSFGWRIHKLNVGEYTVFTIGNPLRTLRIHSVLVQNTHELEVDNVGGTVYGNVVSLRGPLSLEPMRQCGSTPRPDIVMLCGLYTVMSPP